MRYSICRGEKTSDKNDDIMSNFKVKVPPIHLSIQIPESLLKANYKECPYCGYRSQKIYSYGFKIYYKCKNPFCGKYFNETIY